MFMQHLAHKNMWTMNTNRNKDNAFLLDEKKKIPIYRLSDDIGPRAHSNSSGEERDLSKNLDGKGLQKKERNSNVKVIFYFWKKEVSQREIVCSCGMAFMSDDSWKFRLGVPFPVILIQNRWDFIKMERFFPHGERSLCPLFEVYLADFFGVLK